jgi:hypothetical protein
MLLVNPNAVKPATHPMHVEHHRMDNPPGAEDATELAGSEERLKRHNDEA